MKLFVPTGNNKEPRKRGRRPKTTKGNELGGEDQQPRQKKERRDDSASGGNSGPGGSGGRGDPFRRPPISQLKKTGDSWLNVVSADGHRTSAPKIFHKIFSADFMHSVDYGTRKTDNWR